MMSSMGIKGVECCVWCVYLYIYCSDMMLSEVHKLQSHWAVDDHDYVDIPSLTAESYSYSTRLIDDYHHWYSLTTIVKALAINTHCSSSLVLIT
jgi:hypothetical protein